MAEKQMTEKKIEKNKITDKKNKRIAGIRINDMGIELIIGDIIYYVIGQIGILIFSHHRLYVSIGFFLGVLISVAMIIHMSISLEQAMSFNEEGADKHIRKTAAIRLIVCGVLLFIIGFADVGNIVGTLFGVMALKVSAYLQPFTHKVLVTKKSIGKGR